MQDKQLASKAKAKTGNDVAYHCWHFDMQICITIEN